MLLLSAMAMVSAGILLAVSEYEVKKMTEVVAKLKAIRRSQVDLRPTIRETVSAHQAASLQKFSSQQFTAQFHELASSVGLPVDEVAYVLEEGENQPYMRYRIAMMVKTRYLDVRKFIAALAADMPHVVLDSIRCTREAGAVQPLSCEMVFSAFFLKD